MENSPDRISDLPNSIIEHILSFLPVQDAIKFCTLSKHWNSLWISNPNLVFYCESTDIEGIRRFASFVNTTLSIYISSKMNKRMLELRYDICFRKGEQTLSTMKIECISFATSGRKIFEVRTKFSKQFYPGIVAMLHSSPDLEDLTMEIIAPYDHSEVGLDSSDLDPVKGWRYWRSELSPFKCSNRKPNLCISGFLRCVDHEIYWRYLTEFLLFDRPSCKCCRP